MALKTGNFIVLRSLLNWFFIFIYAFKILTNFFNGGYWLQQGSELNILYYVGGVPCDSRSSHSLLSSSD
jgi:hypothetical protein